MESIIQTFQNLTPLLWVSQISGIIGLIVLCISYQFRKSGFLFLSGLSYIFFILESAFACLWANMIVGIISMLRNLTIYYSEKKYNQEMPKWLLAVYIGIMWAVELVYFGISGQFGIFLNYLPPTLVTIFTIMENIRNYYVVKAGALIHETGFLIYYAIYSLPFSVIKQAALLLFIIISIIMMILKTIEAKKNIKPDTNAG